MVAAGCGHHSRAEVAGIEPTGRGSPVPLVLKTRGPTRRPFTSAPELSLSLGQRRGRSRMRAFGREEDTDEEVDAAGDRDCSWRRCCQEGEGGLTPFNYRA